MPLRAVASVAKLVAGEAAARAPGEVQEYRCWLCGVTSVRLRPGVCRDCSKRESVIDLEERRAERLMIPPCFRWARLDLEPFAPCVGGPQVAGVQAIRRVRAFRGDLLTLRGPTGAGKSSLAAAWLMARAAEGMSAIFIECGFLPPDAPDQALAARLEQAASAAQAVVLDDVGKDLGGAPPGQHLAAIRSPPLSRIVEHLHRSRSTGRPQRVLVTTGFPDDVITAAYGADFLRRISPEADGKRRGTEEIWMGPRPAPAREWGRR